MFRPVAFHPHGGRRARRRVPPWLLLLSGGIAIGAGGLLFVQHRYLPPRLSAEESVRLQSAYAEADRQRQSLQASLTETQRRLDGLTQERAGLQTALQTERQALGVLRGELSELIGTLPPDPRGGQVQVRQARFAAAGGRLQYEVMLSRPRGVTVGGSGTAAPLQAVMQLVVAGTPRQGPQTRVRLEPVPIALHAFENLKGTVPLPEGFSAREASVQVLDQPGGRVLGMRVMSVK